MSESIYITKKTVTLKSGEVKEYQSRVKYQKKKNTNHKPVIDLVKSIEDQKKLNLIKDYIISLNNGNTTDQEDQEGS